jgi:DNA polymerase I-like protein with 3'-5' exonuclease and polymerase domains
MYVAQPGYGFVARDFSGIEAVLVGYLAQDRELLRLAGGDIADVHGYIATTAIGRPPDLSWTDADIRGYLGEFRKEKRVWPINGQDIPYDVLRTGCKRSIYLSFYGGTPSRMVQAEPDIFPTKPVAKWYQDLTFDTFPRIKRWQWTACEEAERNGFILSPDGFRQHADGIFQYKWNEPEKKWDKSYGPIAKEVMAGVPQHTGFVYSAVAMVALRKEFPTVHEGLRLSIHDELLGEYPLAFCHDADAVLQSVMERPLLCMPLPAGWNMGEYLHVATEAKFSQPDAKGVHTWSSMK